LILLFLRDQTMKTPTQVLQGQRVMRVRETLTLIQILLLLLFRSPHCLILMMIQTLIQALLRQRMMRGQETSAPV
jgi:predicted exporter